MSDWKRAVKNVTIHGHACYDLSPDQGSGHVTLVPDGEGYDLEGRIDGMKVHASGTEEGFPRLLQELNIDPKRG
jgi:hypothetical protein